MALFFYNWLLRFLFPLLFLHYLRGRLAYKKYSRPVRERFGHFRISLNPEAKMRILIHAVSAGESVAAQPIVKEIRRQFPEAELIFSNVTETGHERAKQIIDADHFVFFPLDYRSAVRRFLNVLRPCRVIILETELWPNFLDECRHRSIPVSFVNARISKHSFERYAIFKSLFSPLLKAPLFYVQSEIDAERIQALGGAHIKIKGNMKVDQLGQNLENPVRKEICSAFEDFERPIVLFGSTHREETKNCLQLISAWKKEGFDSSFMIAPRHMQYLDEYLKLAQELNIPIVQKSSYRSTQDFFCMFIDTFGELANLYEICSIAVIGGSFEPIGGHSILEPALFEKPILYGPHMENGKDLVRIFEKNGASWKTQDFQELKAKIELLLQNSMLRKELGRNAGATLGKISGVTESIIKELRDEDFFTPLPK